MHTKTFFISVASNDSNFLPLPTKVKKTSICIKKHSDLRRINEIASASKCVDLNADSLDLNFDQYGGQIVFFSQPELPDTVTLQSFVSAEMDAVILKTPGSLIFSGYLKT